MNEKLIITPRTKIDQLLTEYPKLESVLIETAPAFKKLKNPVLRKTVAKVATVSQAASIGDVKVEELVNKLRNEVGQGSFTGEDEHNRASINYEKPEWFDESKISKELDVRKMLEAGEHPVHQVMSDLKGLKEDNIYQLIAPFLTVPLIEKAAGIGYKHWAYKAGEEEYHIYFGGK